ncbi:hypothetical protein L1987_44420 [Smallanthus sonchifolius]|uniref:Uncharacterized protein n=1 Tax=Smallanthus sonchifolius TaxID=185202 RepID=A0ACB9GNT5_9ASTR|nr:hypothetical protein L1987_44420 [Smallanthus sonchifolius]
MDVTQVLRMNGGDGDYSYSNNSHLPIKVISMTKHIMEDALTNLYCTMNFPKTLTMADLGCSSGPNTLLLASELLKSIDKIRLELGIDESPEIQIYLNDLPHNDFNTVFHSVSKFQKNSSSPSCYICGVPGSFYTRLFLRKSIHFVYSSYSLMWLSQCRAEEMVPRGRMVLTILGRKSDDPCSKECCYVWDLLATSLNDMVAEGLIEEEKLDSFNIPQYAPSPKEVSNEVEKEGSFMIDCLEVSEVNWDASTDDNLDLSEKDELELELELGYNMGKCMRAVAEPLVLSHFGESIIEEVFERYMNNIKISMSKEKNKLVNVTVSLTRKG